MRYNRLKCSHYGMTKSISVSMLTFVAFILLSIHICRQRGRNCTKNSFNPPACVGHGSLFYRCPFFSQNRIANHNQRSQPTAFSPCRFACHLRLSGHFLFFAPLRFSPQPQFSSSMAFTIVIWTEIDERVTSLLILS